MSIKKLNWILPTDLHGEYHDICLYILPEDVSKIGKRGRMVCYFAFKGELESHNYYGANHCVNIGSGWGWETGEEITVKSGECIDVLYSANGEIETMTHPEWLKHQHLFVSTILFCRVKG